MNISSQRRKSYFVFPQNFVVFGIKSFGEHLSSFFSIFMENCQVVLKNVQKLCFVVNFLVEIRD